MGLWSRLKGLFGPDPPPQDALLRTSDAPPPPVSVPAATEKNAPRPEKKPEDPLGLLRRMAPEQAVREALSRVERTTSALEAQALARWLRENARSEALPGPVKVELAEWFLARAELPLARSMLAQVASGPLGHAAPAMLRLGDLCAQEGDDDGASRWYESALALDLEFPGARERLARRSRTARAGEAGATLLAPSSAAGLGRFELLRELGRGGAGAVFLARDKRLGRELALKLYHPQARADRNARLRGEAQVAAQVGGACAVRVYDLLEDVGAIAMEHCAGASLRTRIARRDFTPEVARAWLRDVSQGLARTHAQGWVHRDLKPGNVLLRGDGRAVLTDFGLSRQAGSLAPAMEGTPAWLAPEARGGGPTDPRADVYAFGVLGLELLGTGDPVLGALLAACAPQDPAARPADGEALVERLVAP
ncbi:MAG: serine/threonine protein kinase [Deltaproteobacteria bacterium]|nr:serine/threonine protein kinase [Deltaproteobacteria bacterium]